MAVVVSSSGGGGACECCFPKAPSEESNHLTPMKISFFLPGLEQGSGALALLLRVSSEPAPPLKQQVFHLYTSHETPRSSPLLFV